jgi:ribonucleoside-diphosphate reductase alpha chain
MNIDKNLIKLNLTRDNLFPEISLKTLRDRYLLLGEISPQQAFARAASAYADDLEHAQRLYDYASKHWFMFSTPILANAGKGDKSLPISCFGGYVEDSLEGIFHHYTETGFLTAGGGGTSGYWGAVRSNHAKDSKSNGKIQFLKVVDSLMGATSQSNTRRGSNAVYLDITDPDIEEFIDIRDPNGDHNRRCLGIGFHHGVNLTTAFKEAIKNDSQWELIDPHTKEVTKRIKARDLWKKIINTRRKTGEPYILFVDTVNEYYPDNLKKKGLFVSASNLCSEIMLHSGPDYAGINRTFICCLSSVNHSKFDEWESEAPQMYEDIVRMLDNVISYFIENAPEQAHQAKYSARMTRDIGVGSMGFHHYLQSKMIPFESKAAGEVNNKLYYLHAKYCMAATKKLGEEKGYYPDAYDFDGRLIHKARNATTMAIAPNASSGIICGNTSPSIEPYDANAFKHTTGSGSFLSKNPVLEQLLESKDQNTNAVWSSIIAHDGSVQHLVFLSEDEKLVFKTFVEIDQMWVVEHAALRQLFLDQGQSLNLKFRADAKVKYINEVHMSGWEKGLKAFYYQHSTAQKSSERISVVKSRETVDPDMIGCTACEG